MSSAIARAAPCAAHWGAAAQQHRRPAAAASACGRRAPRPAHARQRLQPARAGSGNEEAEQQSTAAGGAEEQYVELGPRDDDVLPDSLTDALEDASRATVEALERGVDRCVVRVARFLWLPGAC